MKKENEEIIEYGNCANCKKKLTQMGALLWDSSGYVCNDCDMQMMIIPNIKNYYNEPLTEDPSVSYKRAVNFLKRKVKK